MRSITLLSLLISFVFCHYQEQAVYDLKVKEYNYYSNPISYDLRANRGIIYKTAIKIIYLYLLGSNLERRRRRKNSKLNI
jgi:hypothetical protein